MVKTSEIKVGDIFDVVRGSSKYTRSFADKNPGPYPIYSASVRGPLAYSDKSDYDGKFLTISVNGYAGSVMLVEGRFTVNADRVILLPKIEQDYLPDFNYVLVALEHTLRPLAIGRKVDGKNNEYTKIRPEVISEARIKVPATDKLQPDYSKMKEIGDMLRAQEKLRSNLSAKCEALKDSDVVINIDSSYEDVLLGSEDFSLSIGKRIKKSDIISDGTPVYSANVNHPFGYVECPCINNINKPSLIWGIDGNFDWNLIPAEENFYPTDHCGRLQVLNDRIDEEYLLFELKATKEEYGFDRVFRASLKNIRSVSVRIPVDKDGRFDLDKQRELASRYKRVYQKKDKVTSVLDGINNLKVLPSILRS